MNFAPFIATKSVSIRSNPRQSLKTILAIILDTLRHSRRLQAERTLREYRHLIHQAKHSEPKLPFGEYPHVQK